MAKHPAKCPKCGQRLEFDSAAGERVVCSQCGASLAVPGKSQPSQPRDPLIGQTLGEFEILELLGRGGMGAVYKARQASLDRMVAIKVLPHSLASDESFVERFSREARAAAAVRHPNIIEIHAIGEALGHQFIAMEFIDGETLADLLKREGRLAPARALEVMRQTASALAEAHECGILHRDIKPSNILLDRKGRVKVADFGLAKHEGVDVSVTVTGAALGTPLYMPPEAARGETFDARSDLYSLGATFYQALSGRPPFTGDTPAQLIVKHLEARVPPLEQVVASAVADQATRTSRPPQVPPALCRIIHRLLRKNPAHRYSTADKLLAALNKLAAPSPAPSLSRRERAGVRGDVAATSPTDTMPSAARPVGGVSVPRVLPRWAWIAGGIAAALLLVVVLVLVVGRGRPSALTPPPSPKPGTRNLQPPPPTPKDERNADIVFRNVGTCIKREDYTKAQSYLDRLRSDYSHTKLVAARRADIAALQSQIDAYVKGTAKPLTATPVTPKPRTSHPPEPGTRHPEPPPPAPPPDDDERWTEWEDLFDGKTLDGWQKIEGDGVGRDASVRAGEGTVVLGSEDGHAVMGRSQPFPQTDFEVVFQAMRLTDKGALCSLAFPVLGQRCGLFLGGADGETLCLHPIKSVPEELNPTVRPFRPVRRKWYSVQLRVADGSIRVWVDGQKAADLDLAGHRFGDLPPGRSPFEVRVYEATAAFRAIRLRRLKPVPWTVYTDWPFDAAEAKRRQSETAKALGVPVEQDIDLGDGIKLTLVLIPAGEFLMGHPDKPTTEQLIKLYGGKAEEYERERPQHRVRLTRPFWLGNTEVTQAQWEAVMGDNPSKFKPRPQNPVEQVNWNDCQGFLQKLSARVKKPFRLPTEAEWEYACRAGAPTEFYFGDDGASLSDYAWCPRNAAGTTQQVGRKKPNAWGLHDMAGNVWEWCEDWYAPYDKEPQKDPKGPPSAPARVYRGGSWLNGALNPFRCAARAFEAPSDRNYRRGFRASRTIDAVPRPQAGGQAPPQPAAPAAEADAALAKLLTPAEAKVAAWDFAGASEMLVGGASLPRELLKSLSRGPETARLQEEIERRLSTRRDELQRLAKLKLRMIERINTAQPKLRKGSLLIPGINADLVKADDKGITAEFPGGKTESHDWPDLTSRSVQKLLGLTVDADNADDHLAAGIFCLTVGGASLPRDATAAEAFFDKAKALGAAIDRYLDPLAAAAFASAKALIEEARGAETPRLQGEKLAAAEAALAAIEKKYEKSPRLAAHSAEVVAARAAAKGGIAEAEAEELYRQAARLAKEKDLWALKPLIDKLKADCPEAKLLTDPARKPTFTEMAAAVAKLGEFLTVRKDGKGDFKAIQAAIDAAPPNSTIEIQDSGPYRGPIVIHKAGTTLRGKARTWPIVASLGTERSTEALVEVGAPRVTIERLILTLGSAPGRSATCLVVRAGACRVSSALLNAQASKEAGVSRHSFRSRGAASDAHIVKSMLIGRADFQGPTVITNSTLHRLGYCAMSRQSSLRFCTILSGAHYDVHFGDKPVLIQDCIAHNLRLRPSVVAERCCIIKPGAPLSPGCFNADPQFRDPKNLDYRLKPTSPCRKRASDGGDIGCRFTDEMLEMLKLAHELRRKGIIKF